jgi:hypothetical protein
MKPKLGHIFLIIFFIILSFLMLSSLILLEAFLLPFIVVLISDLFVSPRLILALSGSRENVGVVTTILACTSLILAGVILLSFTTIAVIREQFSDLRGNLISKPQLEAMRAELEAMRAELEAMRAELGASRAKVIAELEADRAKARDR